MRAKKVNAVGVQGKKPKYMDSNTKYEKSIEVEGFQAKVQSLTMTIGTLGKGIKVITTIEIAITIILDIEIVVGIKMVMEGKIMAT